MAVVVDIELAGRDVIADVIAALEPAAIGDANAVAGAATREWLREFHIAKVGDRSWTNPDLPTHGPGRKLTRWGENVAEAWELTESSADGFTVTNDAPGFAIKVGNEDGSATTITPRNSKYLTIPNLPEAHGVRARDFQVPQQGRKGKFSRFGKKRKPDELFFILSNRGVAMLAYKEEAELRVAYWLKEEVEQDPWPDALPTDEVIADRATEAFIEAALPFIEE